MIDGMGDSDVLSRMWERKCARVRNETQIEGCLLTDQRDITCSNSLPPCSEDVTGGLEDGHRQGTKSVSLEQVLNL